MNRRKVLLFLMVMLLLSVQFLSGCSKNAATQTTGTQTTGTPATETPAATVATATPDDELKDFITIKAYAWGQKDKNLDPVLAKINEKLKKDLNAKLEMNYIDWGDADQKVPLLFSSGQDFDIINTAYWWYFNDNAKKGAFLPLNDLLEKYAPNVFKTIPKERYSEISSNGQLLMIPMWKVPIQPEGWIIRKDLREKYGLPPIAQWNAKDIGAYLDAVKKNEPNMIPYNLGKNDAINPFAAAAYEHSGYLWSAPGFENIDMPIYAMADTGKVEPLVKATWFPEVVKTIKDWSDKGYWSKNAYANTENALDSFMAGKSSAAFVNLQQWRDTYYASTKAKNMDVEWVPFDVPGKNKYWARSLSYAGVAINAKSQNAKRALMVIDKLSYDKEYFDLANYGIEGKNYTMTPSGTRLPPADPDKDGFNGIGLAVGTDDLTIYLDGLPQDIQDFNKKISDESVIAPKTADFNPDLSSIQTEIAAYKNVLTENLTPLYFGAEKDPDKAIEDLNAKLGAAGFEKMLTEYNKQLDAYLASKN